MPWMQVNKKKKPSESGTTSNVRKAKRANLQWDYLEEQGADPDTPRGLAKHVAALEKAFQKAKAKLNGEELADPEEPLGKGKGKSSRGRSSSAKPLEKGKKEARSSSAKGKKGKGKGKGEDTWTPRSRSTSAKPNGKGKGKNGKGKKGKKGKGFGKGQNGPDEEDINNILEELERHEEDPNSEKEEEEEPKDETNKKDKPLEKGKDKEEEDLYSHYTGSETEESTPKPSPRSPPAKAPPATAPPVKAPPVPAPAKVLEKIPEQKPAELEQKEDALVALEKAREKLNQHHKVKVQTPKLPAKKACILKPAPGLLWKKQLGGFGKKPKVIVDWHNTLELHDQVPPTHDKALDALLEKADVFLLSYCGPDRKERALTYMHSLRQSHRFAAIQTCSMRSGKDGKSAWGIFWGVEAIFDDNNEICDDCLFYNIIPYAIKTKWEPHYGLSHQGMAFDSFPEAVHAYLEKLDGKSSGSGHQ